VCVVWSRYINRLVYERWCGVCMIEVHKQVRLYGRGT